MSELKDFLKQKKDTLPKEQIRWDKTRENWITEINNFYSTIQEWLAEEIQEELVKTTYSTKKLSEERIGSYDAPIHSAIINFGLKNIKNARLEDILNLYKKTGVSGDDVGKVKQVYKYRNWVAHGRKNQKPLILVPFKAHQRLTKFLTDANI